MGRKLIGESSGIMVKKKFVNGNLIRIKGGNHGPKFSPVTEYLARFLALWWACGPP